MPVKLIYWNNSIQRINIFITTNIYQAQPLKIVEKLPRRQLQEGSVISKKLISHFDVNVYAGIVWILKQFKAFVLKNLIEWESAEWKPALISQYLLSRILLFYYIQLWIFLLFSMSLVVVFIWIGSSICIFTDVIDTSAPLKDRETCFMRS